MKRLSTQLGILMALLGGATPALGANLHVAVATINAVECGAGAVDVYSHHRADVIAIDADGIGRQVSLLANLEKRNWIFCINLETESRTSDMGQPTTTGTAVRVDHTQPGVFCGPKPDSRSFSRSYWYLDNGANGVTKTSPVNDKCDSVDTSGA